MKKLIYVTIFWLLAGTANASKLDTTLLIKGFYITRFDKSEIEEFYTQKVRRMNGDSYSTIIDLKQTDFFIPAEINGTRILNESDLLSQITKASNLDKDTIYFVPKSKIVETYLYSLSKKKLNLSKSICLFKDLASSYPYYLSHSSKKFLYKCIYIEAEAEMFTMKNSVSERNKLDLDLDAVNRHLTNVTIFFLTKITSYNPFTKIEGMSYWLPYQSFSSKF